LTRFEFFQIAGLFKKYLFVFVLKIVCAIASHEHDNSVFPLKISTETRRYFFKGI